ncbi:MULTISPECIES: colicin E3/pyocin S6 family cytotoxin [unclassified Caballeronia]|uniref:colicin E3/pyocin S6 family cytotoxin n=1 Tax=unclassified Caballeronia TaxID=2646786 RepID=UPI002861FAFA|nr:MULTISPECIES: colicin E3/pyocin S6 family cytotoxin [unclassified Caballeronia]MDR5776564.1 colicin E3/pyocin S6 family cytotoxin [Caballeronia sp. LZ002]MDR5852004.1 colicin E3/pyocin S6 family cytotoxin [Caballeronia sp. LZ003]
MQWTDPLELSNNFVSAPKEPGFPDAIRVKPKTPARGGGGLLMRWKLSDGRICEWDSQHGEVEMYSKRGKHLGPFDPETGEPISGKAADSTRLIEP